MPQAARCARPTNSPRCGAPSNCPARFSTDRPLSAGLTWYKIHFENFGNPQPVLIAEAENKHPTAFKLWARGIKPRVQTMGDGTIHLFANGKLATINAKKK